MASLATVEGYVATAVEALTGTLTRVNSDMVTNLETLAVGAVKYQLRKDHLTKIEGGSSNVAYYAATFTVTIHHELAQLSTAERTYTSGVMITHQKSLCDPAWWRAISGVYEVVEQPELQSEAARVGNTITYSYAVSVSFTG